MTGSRGSRHIGQEAEHFVRLPLSLLASGLSVSAKLLLGLLEWHRNKRTNRCNPKLETLAAEFGVSKRTARRALAELRETGFVIEQRHGSKNLQRGHKWPL
jgi:DNA-binding transcriptional ArsR family regulator